MSLSWREPKHGSEKLQLFSETSNEVKIAMKNFDMQGKNNWKTFVTLQTIDHDDITI